MKMKKAKRQNGETTEPTEARVMQQYDMPEGYEEKTSELVGFWNPERGPIHFVPRFARAFDSQLEPTKTSILLIGDAVGAQQLLNKDHDPIECKSGDQIGVWYKPGMSNIKKLADVRVYMYPSGEQDTGKPNPMVTYKIGAPKDGNSLLITDDYRRKSLHTSLPFEHKNKPHNAAPAGDDDENFGDGA